jgi:hypothetical protein
LKTFRLAPKYTKDDRLVCRTFSMPGAVSLTDPQILKVCKGADVFLDTAIRFLTGDESSSSDQRGFAATLFDLLGAGARTVTALHHSAKSSEASQFMTLENVLRGSGEIGAMVSSCWGLRMCDVNRCKIWMQNVKAREYQSCEPFVIEGRPFIDNDGYFKLTHEPGLAGEMSEHLPRRNPNGRPQSPETVEHAADILRLHAAGTGVREIGRQLGMDKSTVSRIIRSNAEPGGVSNPPLGVETPTGG